MLDWVYNNYYAQVFLLSPLKLLGFVPKDNTFGRLSIPINEQEKLLRGKNLFYGEKWLQGTPGTGKVYFQTYWDQDKFPTPKADVLFVHGYGDHSGRFPNHLISYIEAGFRLHLLDLPGHGRSDGVHLAIVNLDILKDGAKEVVVAIKADFSPTKFFISGQSLGGQVVINLGICEPQMLDGIVAFCPCLKVHDLLKPHKIILSIGRFVAKILPLMIVLPRDPGMASKSLVVDQAFVNDPMTYSEGIRGGTGFAIEDGVTIFASKLHLLKVPFLVLQGENDRMVDPQGASILMEKASSEDKTLLSYPGVEHAIFEEETSPKIISDSLNWILARI